MRSVVLAALVLAASLSSALARESITVSHAFLRLISGVPAAGYFTLTNGMRAPLVLTGARSEACGAVTMHQSIATGGMSRMSDVTSVTIPRGHTVAFAPGGYHLMCMKPASSLHIGDMLRITLVFKGGPSLPAVFVVVNARGGRK